MYAKNILNSVISQAIPNTINSLLPIGVLTGTVYLIIKNWDNINPFNITNSNNGGDYNKNNSNYVRSPTGDAIFYGDTGIYKFKSKDINPPPNPEQKIVDPKDENGNLKKIIGYTTQNYPIYETVIRPAINETPPLKIKSSGNSASFSSIKVRDVTPPKTIITPQTSKLTNLKSTSNNQTNSILTPRSSSVISTIFSLSPNNKPISLRL